MEGGAFLGAYAKLQRAPISFDISDLLSVRMEQLGSLSTDFDEIQYLSFCRKSVEEIQVLLKFDQNNGYCTRRRFHLYDNILLNAS